MIVIGIVLLAAAVGGFFYMRHTRGELHAMIGAETLPVSELEMLRSASDEVGGQGHFRKQCEVVGVAHPRPEGLLVSEISGTECVWYRYVVKRRFQYVEWKDGRRETRTKTDQIAEHTSWQGYALRDDQGVLIGVDPNGTRPDRAEQVVKRFEPSRHEPPRNLAQKLGELFFSAPSETLGYEYEEWVIRPGQRLYVLGEVHDKIGPLVIGKPEGDGYFIVSTRTEQELRKSRRGRHTLLAFGVPAVAVLGLVVLVLAILR